MNDMKDRKYKFNINDILESMSSQDLGCYWFDRLSPKYKNKIGFDNDKRGNGDGPYLELTCFPEYVKFTDGDLSKDEKGLVFPYCDYENVDDFVDYLAVFIREYFGSFRYIRVKK